MGAAWTEFYKDRLLSESYLKYAEQRYGQFIHEICRRIKSGDRVIEVGCGLGTMTKLLMRAAVRRPWCGFRCFDISPDMVWLSKLNLQDSCPIDLGDARLPTNRNPDIVHSHGMLEHMSDVCIRDVIAASRADGARAAVHYVPGDKYEAPSFGDERLMSLEAWRDIAAPTDAYTFNDGFDYVLVWDFSRR